MSSSPPRRLVVFGIFLPGITPMLRVGLCCKKAIDFLLHQYGEPVCKVLKSDDHRRFDGSNLVLGQGVVHLIQAPPLLFKDFDPSDNVKMLLRIPSLVPRASYRIQEWAEPAFPKAQCRSGYATLLTGLEYRKKRNNGFRRHFLPIQCVGRKRVEGRTGFHHYPSCQMQLKL